MVSMRVLVLENEPFASVPVVDELRAAGIDVARCNDPDGPAFPCNGLKDARRCPLDAESISVAVVTGHSAATDRDIAPREQGARCALRQHIPLVIVGERSQSPLLPFATTWAAGPESVVTAVHAATQARLPEHERVALEAFQGVLDTHELGDIKPAVTARHHDGGVRIELCPSAPIPAKVAEIAGVRVVGAVRAFDPFAGFLSVTLEGDSAVS